MKKIDLIIPTYNRPFFLRRILDYYQINGRDFNFIIADSSNPKNKAQNRKLVNTYPKLNILYIDKFPQNLSQHDKFAKMIKYAKSKYVCFCADDDFIIPNGIKEAVNFLEKNPDYSAAHGNYISFYLHKTPFYSKQFWWRFLYSPYSISSSNPIDRLVLHLTNYNMVVWAVRRTKVVKKCYEEFSKSKIDPYLLPVFGELLPDVLTVIYGKTKHLNNFYAARQSFSQILNSYPSLIDAKKIGIYEREYAKFKNCLINNLSIKGQTSKDKIASIINLAIEMYIKYSFQEHILNKINYILNRSPKFISSGIRILHAIYLFSKNKKSNIGLIDNPSSKYFNDYEVIRKLVLKHNI